MEEELIKKYISHPMVLTVFKQDIQKFNEFKLSNLYVDMLESIIDRFQQDYFRLKAEMYSKHHNEVKRLDTRNYKVNDELMEFTPEELKEITKVLMSEYLHGNNARRFERKDRTWKGS
ncbi:hypothetical protein [Ornithinibacillus californiensis]|uniref:hypothetical protein n=1 Tax=Ornithinibacillus californiensis TaxID=161536 RepID=UPI00064DE078|nr:hypothetical protein [Ornithinibacillus californiensis]